MKQQKCIYCVNYCCSMSTVFEFYCRKHDLISEEYNKIRTRFNNCEHFMKKEK